MLPFYAGRVKCIYIDPPYNTRSAFAHYDDNLEHSQWLAMIYPRLEMLRDLLAEDGSIWVSIDDNEGHYLKVVMDEVFGRGNFVAHVVWQKSHTRETELILRLFTIPSCFLPKIERYGRTFVTHFLNQKVRLSDIPIPMTTHVAPGHRFQLMPKPRRGDGRRSSSP